jgi:RimJ/RimL family protein N-acetyltransferase
MHVAPVTLAGRHVRLEPLARGHVDALAEVGLDPNIWRWIHPSPTTRDEMVAWVETALTWQAEGHAVPFATVSLAENRVVGSTRFAALVPEHRRVEIGWTWIAPRWQRSAVNTEAKLLMLTHAFETWRLRRVEFKTHAMNERSRAAIQRLGATQEGIFRKHMTAAGGAARDTVYFSIIDDEWPGVRARLLERLARG